MTSVTNKNSSNTTLSSFSYAYNNDNLRTSCTELSGDVVSYTYSANHRLTAESRTGSNSYSASYTLDGVGNRTSQTIGSATTSFTLNNDDQLTATSSSSGGFVNSYSYNNNGDQTNRTLSGTSWTLEYDYDGQLTSTATGGSTVSTFVYDALGRRYSRANGGTTTVFYYGPGGILTEKQGGSFTSAYAYGNGLIRKDGEYPMFDGLGSERTVTNSSQTVTGTLTQDGFGNLVASTGSSSNPYKFVASGGYRDDGDCGLTQVGFRFCDAQVGRFITANSDFADNAYLYCEQDPVNHVDPSGSGQDGPRIPLKGILPPQPGFSIIYPDPPTPPTRRPIKPLPFPKGTVPGTPGFPGFPNPTAGDPGGRVTGEIGFETPGAPKLGGSIIIVIDPRLKVGIGIGNANIGIGVSGRWVF